MFKKDKYSQLKERKYSFERRLNPLRTYMNNRVLLVRKLNKEEKNRKDFKRIKFWTIY